VPVVRPLGRSSLLGAVLAAACAQTAAAQVPAPVVHAPSVVATGVPIVVRGQAQPGVAVVLARRTATALVPVVRTTAGAAGAWVLRYTPHRTAPRYRLVVTAAGAPPVQRTVRSRDVTLVAAGDVNLGDGVADVMAAKGTLYPWGGVAPTLRAADVAFANLECSVSLRGAPVEKEFRFRGNPGALRRVVAFAGLDVLNLANNHVGDYGTPALLDTVRAVRSAGALPVGAGATLAAARRAQVVTRLGLRIAFVGFSDIGPPSFFAGASSPGTSFADDAGIAAAVRAAHRRADVVVATFHWGIERDVQEDARQRGFAAAALRAGADAVIGAHPHVLQPIRRRGRTLVAYSLGNFVWAAGSPAAARTGMLRLRLSTRGVEGSRLIPATIVGARPRVGRG
jgi:poly-gamma-glutamate synthesis protein (capsule biosynthesis protein)